MTRPQTRRRSEAHTRARARACTHAHIFPPPARHVLHLIDFLNFGVCLHAISFCCCLFHAAAFFLPKLLPLALTPQTNNKTVKLKRKQCVHMCVCACVRACCTRAGNIQSLVELHLFCYFLVLLGYCLLVVTHHCVQ